MDDFSLYEDLLHELPSKPLNIFDVAGFPHYENVISNVLAFFLDPNNEHPFRDLFLSSLLSSVNKTYNRDNNSVKVIREDFTGQGRIDLVIVTDQYVIGIENKIRAELHNNDLGDYARHLEAYKNNIKQVIKLVLTVNDLSTLEMDYCKKNGFKHVKYLEIFNYIESENIELERLLQSNRWGLLLNDFIQTISDEGGYNMEFTDVDMFIGEQEEKITKLLKAKKEYDRKLKSRIHEVLDALRKRAFNSWAITDSGAYGNDTVFFDVTSGKYEFSFDLILTHKGWSIYLFNRPRLETISEVISKIVKKKDIPQVYTSELVNHRDHRKLLLKKDISVEMNTEGVASEFLNEISTFISFLGDSH